MTTDESLDLGWLLTSFTARVPDVLDAVAVSADGLLIAMSDRMHRATADQFAAVASGLTSLTQGAARVFEGGDVRQVLVEMDHGYLFITSISDGSCLAVAATSECDIGLVGYEMAMLVSRCERALTPELVSSLQAALPR
jgi:predicted regulator of Ras-like GTPase activity (Roadblock/LC7/MglB family)